MKKFLVIGAAGAAAAAALAWITKSKLETRDSLDIQNLARSNRKMLIVGATSAIAQEAAKLFAHNGDKLFLAARNPDRVQAVADDLKIRGADKVDYAILDLNDFDRHGPLIEQAAASLDGLDTVLIAHGTLGDQQASQQDFAVAQQELKTNLLSVISLLTPLANRFEAQGYGTIAVISSVAGDRGRQSNYVYGTAKAATTTFLQGLRNRLSKAGVSVITIKPGLVDTPMTAHLKKGMLFVGPEVIGRGIYQAIQQQKDVVYVPWFWWGIMSVIKAIPEAIFKRLSLP